MNDMKTAARVELDGSAGEGGGQVLRSALSLSMITGIPFRIDRIRARRSKPGLLRQHLTAVNAAAAICGARVDGAELGSAALVFEPGPVRGGDYRFAIGSAGSTTLVLQTLLPALWFADAPATVRVSGGTHNRAAPPADFLIRCWLPLMREMGADTDIELLRHGFYPAGGGELHASVRPVERLRRIEVLDRGERLGLEATAIVAGVPHAVARRELDRVAAQMPGFDNRVRELPAGEGPGNALLLEARYARLTAMSIGFGERGVTAEAVADGAVGGLRRYLDSPAAVDEHLADQLLLPMALAGGGALTTPAVSGHLSTNLEVIARFLPVEAAIGALGEDCWRVSLA